jgi:hypothetical protein
MLGWDPHLPIAPTGDFPGFVNPEDPVKGDLVVFGMDDDSPSGPARGRRPTPPVDPS